MRSLLKRRQPIGFCLIDWHGSLFNGIVDYLAVDPPQRPIYLLDPSRAEYITGFNPFSGGEGDMSAEVSRPHRRDCSTVGCDIDR